MTYIWILFALLIFCGCTSKALLSSPSSEAIHLDLSGAELIAKLDQLEFFNLTDSTDLAAVKEGFRSSYLKYHFFEGQLRGNTTTFLDNRYYWVDCETLFEVGGLVTYLTSVKETFNRLGLVLEFGEEQHEQSETHLRRTIIINGTEYVAYEGAFSYLDWDLTYVRFLEILNEELSCQGSKEQFYPILCGNGGAFVLLTPEQFTVVKQYYPNDDAHPRTLEDWKVAYGL